MPRAHIRDGPTRGVRKAPTSCSPSNRPCDDVHVQSRFIDDPQVVLQDLQVKPMGIGDSKPCHQEGSDLGLTSPGKSRAWNSREYVFRYAGTSLLRLNGRAVSQQAALVAAF